ncbi:MAG: FKBP-type peptidyl-prolyl cis-trans isomerase [Fermentimonas sp.]|jgi:FKBP-type peptidyl-prolyl cis-trans isomerase FklB
MMRKQLLFFTTILALLFASCEKDETVDDQWKEMNEAVFNKIANNPEYTRLESQSKKGFIMYKELQKGDGAKPMYTSKVKLLYTGYFKRDWSRPDNYTDGDGNYVINKIIFDTTDQNNIPRSLDVKNLIDGFQTALQHMNVGSKWEVWIPYELGYGDKPYSRIRECTTLVFEIELVDIISN